MRIREIDTHGTITNKVELVSAKGFYVGQRIQRKADHMEATIRSIGNDSVQLNVNGEVLKASSDSFLQGLWKEVAVKRDPLALDWSKSSVVKSFDFKWACMKGLILEAMRNQFNAIKIEDLAVYIPRDVKAEKPFAIGKLILPCCTNKVSLIEGDDSAGLVIGTFVKKKVVLGSCNQFPKDDDAGCLNPFWICKTSPDKEKCNMVFHVKMVEFKMSADCTLPVMKNFKKVEAGDSLVVHQPDTSKKSQVEELQPVLKRQRVKGHM